MGSDPVSALAV